MNEKGWLARYHHDFNRIAPLFSTFARINLTLEGQKCPADFPPFYLSNDYCGWRREGRENSWDRSSIFVLFVPADERRCWCRGDIFYWFRKIEKLIRFHRARWIINYNSLEILYSRVCKRWWNVFLWIISSFFFFF